MTCESSLFLRNFSQYLLMIIITEKKYYHKYNHVIFYIFYSIKASMNKLFKVQNLVLKTEFLIIKLQLQIPNSHFNLFFMKKKLKCE